MQEDTNLPKSDNPAGGSTEPAKTNQPSLPSSKEKAPQPTKAILQEVKSQQTAAPTPPAPPTPQTQPLPQPQPQAGHNQPGSTTGTDQVPVGVPASSLGLDSSTKTGFNWKSLIKPVAVVAALAVLTGGALFARNYFAKLNTKTLTNSGYTYEFKYYKKANMVYLGNGTPAYKYLNSSTAGVNPVSAPLVTDCTQVGRSWTQAFKVETYGSEQPVCTAKSGNLMVYAMIFPALNKHHLFTVIFNDNSKLSSDSSTLKTIFASVTASQK